MGYSTLGLTDAADFGGVVRFALAAWDAGIAPIIGAELNIDGCPTALLARTAEGCREPRRAHHARAIGMSAELGGMDGRRRARGDRTPLATEQTAARTARARAAARDVDGPHGSECGAACPHRAGFRIARDHSAHG